MGGGKIRVEDVVEVRLHGAEDLADRLVVLLRACGRGPWELLAPSSARLRDLDQGELAFVVPISVGAEPGIWRWAIALPDPALLPADLDSAQQEAALREGIGRGEVPVCTFQLEVTP